MERLKGEGLKDWLMQHLASPWHGHQTVASELSVEIIGNIHERFFKLDSSIRLGVLFSLVSLKKSQQIELRGACQGLIDHACSDVDDWVRLVSQILKHYPTEGTLRFNVEQFADHLGVLLDTLSNHIARDGIKFHPREFAFLNDSVCKAGQGKDPKTMDYPPIAGPSVQHHFNIRQSHTSTHKNRADRLKRLAEEATPIIPGGPPSIVASSGVNQASSALSGASTAGSGPGSIAATPAQTPGVPPLGAPPRPVKSSSSGLFVSRKPAGSFLRNNAPRPMPLPRNPSSGQLPLRSPRLDTPTTPRLNQKSSRIQILDLDQGNEIMQSMQDAKRRKEEAEQREKELKKEQKALEAEAKKQLDAEKKAQVIKEREDKKKEREEAKKQKERQKQEREEQAQLQQQEREKEKQEKEQKREGRALSDNDDDEASLSSRPAKKRTRNSSRITSLDTGGDDDYDNDAQERVAEPTTPLTPSLANRYSTHGIDDTDRPTATPMDYTPSGDHTKNSSDSYFPPNSQQAQELQQQYSNVEALHPTLFQDTNRLTPGDRAYITAFLEGHPVIRPNGNDISYQIVMNQEEVQDASGKTMYELILIEMNFETGEWRKIKRKRSKPAPTVAV
ncbi:hypothetical protein BGZ75_002757 [Mortierella antarctica]|nr:hypothetical protein BGZ75_002757 [Mortierella antarctica]